MEEEQGLLREIMMAACGQIITKLEEYIPQLEVILEKICV